MSHHQADLLDRQAYRDTVIHRLDPRAKILATLGFILTVASFPKYETASLTPLFVFPAAMIVLGDLPPGLVVRRTLVVLPLAVAIGFFNPFLDRQPVSLPFGLVLARGWLSFASIILRFLLSVSAGLILVATTSFPNLCRGLTKMRVPRVLVTQLLFLYRYLFILVEEGLRMKRARDLRSPGRRRLHWRLAAHVLGALFIRTVDRAERIYQAMNARGFNGEILLVGRLRIRPADTAFLAAVLAGCVLLRFFPLTHWVGQAARRWW